MKKLLYFLAVNVLLLGTIYADQYVVEFDKVTKKQMSSYILPDGELAWQVRTGATAAAVPTGTIYILVKIDNA